MKKNTQPGKVQKVSGTADHIVLCCPVPIMGSLFVNGRGFFVAQSTKIFQKTNMGNVLANMHAISDGSNVQVFFIMGVDSITVKKIIVS